jgi:DNA-binding IclR family transcriptional regulator
VRYRRLSHRQPLMHRAADVADALNLSRSSLSRLLLRLQVTPVRHARGFIYLTPAQVATVMAHLGLAVPRYLR